MSNQTKYFLVASKDFYYCVPGGDLCTANVDSVNDGDELKFKFGTKMYQGKVMPSTGVEIDIVNQIKQIRKEKRTNKDDSFHSDRPRRSRMRLQEKWEELKNTMTAAELKRSKGRKERSKKLKIAAFAMEEELSAGLDNVDNCKSKTNNESSQINSSKKDDMSCKSSECSSGSSSSDSNSSIDTSRSLKSIKRLGRTNDVRKLQEFHESDNGSAVGATSKNIAEPSDEIASEALSGSSNGGKEGETFSGQTDASTLLDTIKESEVDTNEASKSESGKNKAGGNSKNIDKSDESANKVDCQTDRSRNRKKKKVEKSKRASSEDCEPFRISSSSSDEEIRRETNSKKSKKNKRFRPKMDCENAIVDKSREEEKDKIEKKDMNDDESSDDQKKEKVEKGKTKKDGKSKKVKKKKSRQHSSSYSSDSSSSSTESDSDSPVPKKRTKAKRNLEIYGGTNFLWTNNDPGVVQRLAPYKVYVKEVVLKEAMNSKSVTQFIRVMVDKVFTSEALQNAPPQGFPPRGKGRKYYKSRAVPPRLHPHGMSALIGKVLEAENKTWRPKTSAPYMRGVFSTRCCELK